MIIKKVELNNWGPHKHLEFDSEDHIVGIIGSNGRGKSNLLQAIAYALTGDLDKTKGTSYIRHFGSPNAAKEASVKIVFQKGTEEGTIIRKIKDTGTTSRQMTWGGKTVKSAAEVEKLMAEILGADKEAMRNAVYIKQGDIARLVRGTPSERQEINLKLMNLHFTEQNVDQIRKMKAIANNCLVDYVQIEAMLIDQKDQLLADIAEYTKKLEPLKEAHNLVSKLQQIYDLRVSTANEGRLIDTLNAQLTQKKHERKKLLNNRLEEEIVQIFEDNNITIKEAEQYLKFCNEYKTHVTNLEAKQKELATIETELERIQKSYKGSILTEQEYNDAVARSIEISNIRNVLREFRNLYNNYTEATKHYSSLHLEMQQVYGDTKGYEKLIDDRNVIINNITKLSEDIAIASLVDHDTCPICGNYLNEEIKTTFKTEYDNNRDKLDAAKKKLEELNKIIKDFENEKIKKQTCLSQYSEYLPKALKNLEDFQNTGNNLNIITTYSSKDQELEVEDETIKQNIAIYKSSSSVITATTNKRNFLKAQVELLQTEFDKFKKLNKDNAEYSKEEESICLTYLNELLESNKTLKEVLDNIHSLDNKISELEGVVASTYDNYGKQVDILYNLLEKLPITLEDESIEGTHAIVQKYRNSELEYSSLVSLLNKSTNELKEVEHKLLDCRDNISKNNKRLTLIEDLQTTAEIICKNGIPLAYANEVFAHITPMVQDMLERMQANFTVSIDPDRPMTYKFIRTDDDSGYEMPQERLSGGQAIRLAIALLIACQQAILPDVGLLILDEPSSHIDAEGVEHMRDMFIQLEDILKNSNMQVILVDHNPTLVAAFDKTIKL